MINQFFEIEKKINRELSTFLNSTRQTIFDNTLHATSTPCAKTLKMASKIFSKIPLTVQLIFSHKVIATF